MNKNNSETFDHFYLRMTQRDYLNDLELSHNEEPTKPETNHGLSEEQVSQIARDSLEQAHRYRHQRSFRTSRPQTN